MIPPDLAEALRAYNTVIHAVRFDGNEEEELLGNMEFAEACRTEAPEQLQAIANHYLNMHDKLADTYPPDSSERVHERVEGLRREIMENRAALADTPSVLGYIRKQIRSARKGTESHRALKPHTNGRSEVIQAVLERRRDGRYSIKDICKSCKVSMSTYYTIVHRAQQGTECTIRPQGRPLTEQSLQEEEKEHIKRMADTPERSYTVPEMCAEIAERYHHTVSRKKVYTYLTEKLGYSYKRNNYKPPVAFQPRQVIVRYKVCKALLECLLQGKTVISIDESGFNLGIHREYSYAKRGERPYRMGVTKSPNLNLIMAVTDEGVLAYQVRKGCHNEHSFISFILDLTRKLHQLGPDHISKAVLFIDNAPFHTSRLAMKLLNLLPFPVLFNAPCFSSLNPIEYVFGIIKRQLKKINLTNL